MSCKLALYIVFYIFPYCLHPTGSQAQHPSLGCPDPWPLTPAYTFYHKMGLDDIFKENSSNHVIHSHRHFRKSHYHHIGCRFFITTFKTSPYDLSDQLSASMKYTHSVSQPGSPVAWHFIWQKLSLPMPLPYASFTLNTIFPSLKFCPSFKMYHKNIFFLYFYYLLYYRYPHPPRFAYLHPAPFFQDQNFKFF